MSTRIVTEDEFERTWDTWILLGLEPHFVMRAGIKEVRSGTVEGRLGSVNPINVPGLENVYRVEVAE